MEAEEQLERRRGRELGRAAEAALGRVELRRSAGQAASSERRWSAARRRRALAGLRGSLDELVGLLLEVAAPVPVGLGDRLEDLGKLGIPWRGSGGK